MLGAGPIKRIVVNRHVISKNRKEGRADPPLSVQTSRGIARTSRIKILDKDGNIVATLIYEPELPLKCGATVWLETNSRIVVEDSSPSRGDGQDR